MFESSQRARLKKPAQGNLSGLFACTRYHTAQPGMFYRAFFSSSQVSVNQKKTAARTFRFVCAKTHPEPSKPPLP